MEVVPPVEARARSARLACALLLGGLAPALAGAAAANAPIAITVRRAWHRDLSVPIAAIRLAADADATESRAAGELARYLQEMTGTALPVRRGGELPAQAGCLWVGRAADGRGWIDGKDLAYCGPDGFVIRQGPYGIAVVGGSPKGTLYGSYRLLEDLGVRFFCGQVPKTPSPVLPYAFKKDRPFFEMRTVCQTEYGSGLLQTEFGDPHVLADPSIRTNLWIDHTQGFLVPLNAYWKSHREYYADNGWLDGFAARGATPPVNRVWLCMSNPEVRRIAGDTLLEWMKREPDKRFFSIYGGDGSNWCHCARCAAVGNLSDNTVAFANELAARAGREYPDQYLVIGAYHVDATLQAPLTQRPAPNVLVTFAPYREPYVGSRIHSFLSGPMNRGAREAFDRWYAMAPRSMAAYDYNFSSFLPLFDKMIAQLKEYARRDMHGVFYCGNGSMLGGLFLYVNAKLLWNPRLDDRKLIREYCDGYYGAAGPAMTELVALIRRQLHEPGVAFPPGRHGTPAIDEGMKFEQARHWATETPGGRAFYTPEFCRQASELVARAERAVRDKPVLLGTVSAVRRELAGMLAPREETREAK